MIEKLNHSRSHRTQTHRSSSRHKTQDKLKQLKIVSFFKPSTTSVRATNSDLSMSSLSSTSCSRVSELFRSPQKGGAQKKPHSGYMLQNRLYMEGTQWQFSRPLGSGGMGEVYSLREDDASHSSDRVVKVGRVEEEWKALTALQESLYVVKPVGSGPIIPSYTDMYGDVHIDMAMPQSTVDYIVLERARCDGRVFNQLPSLLKPTTDLPPLSQALFFSQLFLNMACALRDVHRLGYAHNDIKPENFLVFSGDPLVKLADFGTSRPKENRLFEGTYSLLPPEEVLGIKKDPAMPWTQQHRDLFDLGMTLASFLLNGEWVYNAFPDVTGDHHFGFNLAKQDAMGMVVFLREIYKVSEEQNNESVFDKCVHRFSEHISRNYPYLEGIKPLLLGLLSPDYRQRPSADELCRQLRKCDSPIFQSAQSTTSAEYAHHVNSIIKPELDKWIEDRSAQSGSSAKSRRHNLEPSLRVVLPGRVEMRSFSRGSLSETVLDSGDLQQNTSVIESTKSNSKSSLDESSRKHDVIQEDKENRPQISVVPEQSLFSKVIASVNKSSLLG